MFTFLFVANLILCLLLTGLIWTIQIVHYPLFLEVGKAAFKTYLIKHQQKITVLVAPLMVAELGCSFVWLLFFYQAAFVSTTLQFMIVVAIWLSTFFVQVPLHQSLNKVYNPSAIKKLVKTNWLRTALWTLRSILLVYVLIDKYFIY